MLEIETRLDLGVEREQALVARWGIRRLAAERTLDVCKVDPSLHLIQADVTWEANILDHMLSRVPERARTFGESAEVAAWGSLRMLEGLIHDIREGKT